MNKKFQFSEADKNLVKEAVQSLEKESSGEIVVYFARSSDDYREACWKLAAILGLITLVVFGVLSWLWMLPEDITIPQIVESVVITMLLGYFIPFFLPSLRLGFISESKVSQRVITKAHDVFLQEQMFDTIDRTGLLIFISELEHQVHVMGDKGINEKIEQKDWQEVVQLVITGIKGNQVAEGISNAIGKCKTLLLENGFTARENNTNELSDHIRIEE